MAAEFVVGSLLALDWSLIFLRLPSETFTTRVNEGARRKRLPGSFLGYRAREHFLHQIWRKRETVRSPFLFFTPRGLPPSTPVSLLLKTNIPNSNSIKPDSPFNRVPTLINKRKRDKYPTTLTSRLITHINSVQATFHYFGI